MKKNGDYIHMHMYMYIYNSLCCTPEANKTLQINCTSIKIVLKLWQPELR